MMEMDLDGLKSILPESLPLVPALGALDGLNQYLRMLVSWNKALNLTGFGDPVRIVRELICDSFHLAWFLDRLFPDFSGTIWDPGAGAGLPGIPLRMVWQKGTYIMIESRQKRALFLANVLASLGLPGTFAHEGRVENFILAEPEPDLVVSRAFMPWQKLLTLFGGHSCKCAIVMANSRPPENAVNLLDLHAYQADTQKRWLWAVAP